MDVVASKDYFERDSDSYSFLAAEIDVLNVRTDLPNPASAVDVNFVNRKAYRVLEASVWA